MGELQTKFPYCLRIDEGKDLMDEILVAVKCQDIVNKIEFTGANKIFTSFHYFFFRLMCYMYSKLI